MGPKLKFTHQHAWHTVLLVGDTDILVLFSILLVNDPADTGMYRIGQYIMTTRGERKKCR